MAATITIAPPGANTAAAEGEEVLSLPSLLDHHAVSEKKDKEGGSEKTKSGPPSAGSGKAGSSTDEAVVDIEDNPDLARLTVEQRAIVLDQVHNPEPPQVGFFGLFRFTTRFELLLNAVGIVFAIAAGSTQPLTIVFGSLTTSFTTYSTALMAGDDALLAVAKADLFGQVNKNCLYLVGIGIGMACSVFILMSTWIYTGESATRRIREKYFQAVLRQNVAYFDALGSGEIVTRIQTDTHLIQSGISQKIALSVMHFSTFVVGFIVAFIKNWRLALVVSTIIPAIFVTGFVMEWFMTKYRLKMLEQTAKGGTLAEEVISSVRNAHAFGTQRKLTAMYERTNAATVRLGQKSAVVNAAAVCVFFIIIYGSYGLAFYWGTTLLIRGQISSGDVIAVFFAILIGAFSLIQVPANLQAVAFARGASAKIFATIARVPVIDSASTQGLKPDHFEGTLSLSNVDFIYPSRPGVTVLNNFTATFPKGKMTALVGQSGCGKSTIVGLAERFYDPVGGIVAMDGIPLKDLNLTWLRSKIGLVSQEPTLFLDTVAKNIEHGLIGTKFADESPKQRRERVIDAAKQANADGFIRLLPDGYDSMIGERGALLSGGMKQRIAIARAIVGDPQILLLDEATSALDTASELVVQDALEKASIGRTTITIAHRLSTIKEADQIIVMNAGRILESASTNDEGSAHELLLKNRDGPYSSLVTAQRFRDEAEKDFEDRQAACLDEEDAGLDVEATDKAAFAALKRSETGRSVASVALSEMRHRELEEGVERLPGLAHVFVRMLRMNSDSPAYYVVGLLAAIASGCVYPVFGIVFGGMLDIFSKTNPAELRSGGDRQALYCFIIALAATAAAGTHNFCFGASVELLSGKLRNKLFATTLRQDIAFFDKEENSTGLLTQQIADLPQKVNGLFGVTLGTIIQSIFTVIIGSIIGLVYAWRISLVGIACIPLIVGTGWVELKVVVLKDERNKKAHEKSAQMACESASAIKTVQSLTREKDCCKIYSDHLEKPFQESNRTSLWTSLLYGVIQSMTLFVLALIFFVGSRWLVTGQISSKGFFISIMSVVFASVEAGAVFSWVPDMSKARGAAAAIVKLFDTRPTIDAEEPTGDKMDVCRGDISLRNVHFRYAGRPHVKVLRGLNLEIKSGEFAALVGPSGCGKSTCIQLLERFYDPLAGSVNVDGVDVSSLDVVSYRKHISLVSQEPTLYAGTVKFNITLGANKPAEDVTQEEIEQACRDANIHDFVTSLPDGYDTEVGGKGSQLSGGQKQRIAIARALIRNPKILLLDEATAALDSQSERVVQAALDSAAKGRTTIAVAHRLSSIQNADVIFVLKDGVVAEKGKHFELLALRGMYYDLVAQQSLEKTA